MKFRIAEYRAEHVKGNRFFIEKGTIYRETGFMGLKFQQTAWTNLMGRDDSPLTFPTFEEAILAIKELNKQKPIIHHVQ